MRNRKIFLLIFLALAGFSAGAQENSFFSGSTVLIEENFRNTLWFDSNNASGLGFAPLADYGNAFLVWNHEDGDLSTQQSGTAFNDYSLKTSGAVALGGFRLWGSFLFQNKFDKNCRYNCSMYEIDNLMPYYVADTTLSDWTRQNYELALKAAGPVLWDRVCFALELNYDSKVGAKQKDPRLEAYKYRVNIQPSATVRIGAGHILGLSLRYENGFERSAFSNANGRFDQTIYLMNGLGNATTWKVGGNDGLKTAYYKANLFGGGLQWAFSSGSTQMLADLCFDRRNIEGFTTPTLPKRTGRAVQNILGGKFQCLWGKYRSDKITLDASYGMSAGFEPVQQRDDTPRAQQWVLLAENEMSTYSLLEVNVDYDHLFGNSDSRGYDWKVGGGASVRIQDDLYKMPLSQFSSTNLALSLLGDRQFKLKSTSMRLGADVLFNKSLSGDYSFSSLTEKLAPLQGLYVNDLKYWTTDYVRAGLSFDVDIQLRKVVLDVGVNASYAGAIGGDLHRTVAGVKFGLLF